MGDVVFIYYFFSAMELGHYFGWYYTEAGFVSPLGLRLYALQLSDSSCGFPLLNFFMGRPEFFKVHNHQPQGVIAMPATDFFNMYSSFYDLISFAYKKGRWPGRCPLDDDRYECLRQSMPQVPSVQPSASQLAAAQREKEDWLRRPLRHPLSPLPDEMGVASAQPDALSLPNQLPANVSVVVAQPSVLSLPCLPDPLVEPLLSQESGCEVVPSDEEEALRKPKPWSWTSVFIGAVAVSLVAVGLISCVALLPQTSTGVKV